MSTFNTSYGNTARLASIDNRKLTFKTTGGISFQYFWSLKDQNTKLLLVILLSIFSGCLSFFFVEKVGIYSPGMFSIWQAIARLAKSRLGAENSKVVYLLFFWVFNSIMNVVLAFCTCKAIGKDMTKLSVIFIVGSTITGLILSNLPSQWNLKDFFIFSNPFSHYPGCSHTENDKAQFLQWMTEHGAQHSSASNGVIVLFIYAITYSILNSLMTSLLYALGGCGGGIDWIIFYLFKTKSYFANKLIFYTGLFFSFSSYTIGSYLPWALNSNGAAAQFSSLISNFFSPLFFALLSSIFVKKFIFNVFYPRFKFINVKIFTTMWLDIRKELIERKFPHSFTIVPSYGSYSLRSQTQLEFICLLIELQELTQIIRKIDKNCFICSVPIKSLNARIGI